ncbi:MAG: hypothetical protein P8J86_05370 [Phycisphaerales bacterium]|nr:hypothetical protein [Phycisphaerales bacterium]
MPAANDKHGKLVAMVAHAAEAAEQGRFFEAEREADKVLQVAREANDFELMNQAIDPLCAARMGRLAEAVDVGQVTINDRPVTEDLRVAPGAYLIQPPQVGMDGRRLRLACLEHEVPVLVICREPITQLKMCPVVLIAPGATMRTKIEPPVDLNAPDLAWMLNALSAIGDWAVSSLDETMPVERRINALCDRLYAVPEHEALHRALQAACQEACSKPAA